ncbi:hypothetical protein EAI30_04115 [Romboutsia ilealis]|uniref:Uncharacterized protein n=1 Tax=Romboutsia faecis TaxID=2764597 RepID=A0ABR7JKZ5_9FIRM|nr:hypothetical protein [Romboutsia faecis]MBC5995598.1 hypothetical protein [Romboutsia faecis]MRN23800.1 hypothetical protein [Romboutsia ilealis]
MNNIYSSLNLLPTPWMKKKLETIYDKKLNGNLFLIYNELKSTYEISCNHLIKLLDDNNITIDSTHPIYFYFPLEVDNLIKTLILTIKYLIPKDTYIILGGFIENYPNLNESDCVYNLYNIYPELKNTIDFSYLIDKSKEFEIFTSLSDTHRIHIDPASSCTVSGPMLEHNLNKFKNATHVSFIKLLSEESSDFVNYYIKGLTNKNNNFNFNF